MNIYYHRKNVNKSYTIRETLCTCFNKKYQKINWILVPYQMFIINKSLCENLSLNNLEYSHFQESNVIMTVCIYVCVCCDLDVIDEDNVFSLDGFLGPDECRVRLCFLLLALLHPTHRLPARQRHDNTHGIKFLSYQLSL